MFDVKDIARHLKGKSGERIGRVFCKKVEETIRSAHVRALGGEGREWSSPKPTIPGNFTSPPLSPSPEVLVIRNFTSSVATPFPDVLAIRNKSGGEGGIAPGPAPAGGRGIS
jgi:hypothetical protein